MKYIFFIGFLLVSVLDSSCQNPYFDFEYEKSNYTSEVVHSRNIDSLTRRDKVVLQSNAHKIPFFHFLNARNSDNAYVILLHGLGGKKEHWTNPTYPYIQYTKNLTAIKDSLLVLGFNLVIIDARFHGERSYELNFSPPGPLYPGFPSPSQAKADLFYELYSSTIKEVRLIMDFLEDSNKESPPVINLIGSSMGGALSLILNAIDDRINAVVACATLIAQPYTASEKLNWTGEISAKMEAISPLYHATAQKSPIIMLMGKIDPFIPENEARDFYKQIPIDDKKLIFYDSGHELPTEHVHDAIGWIIQHN